MIKIIPAIDIIAGQCVRLTRGDYSTRKVYSENPVDMARSFQDAGLRILHVVDLDGAKASSPVNLKVLEAIASRTEMKIEWGGGIKTKEALDSVLDSGATWAICGSVAVTHPEEFSGWLRDVGAGKIVLGADVRDGKIATHGWLKEAELSAADLIARYLPQGLVRTVCTDISRDGMLQGPSFELYCDLQAQFPSLKITVSGGIGSAADIDALSAMGLDSVIVGKALYEGRITLKELEERCLQKE